MDINRQSAYGNAIVEYLLPATVVTVASISVIIAIGSGLNTQFGLVKSDAQSKASNAQTQIQNQQTLQNGFKPTASSVLQGKGIQPSAMLINGVANVVQTVGANGGTDMLATTLDNYIQYLEQNSNLTPAQINQLSQLANAGHELASEEKALQDALNSGQSTVTYNGQTYSIADYQAQFGFNTTGWNNDDILNQGSGANSKLAPFINLYQQAQADGALNDPAVASVVKFLSSQIAALNQISSLPDDMTSLATQNSAYSLFNVTYTNPPATIPGVTNSNSSGICTSGKSADSGTSCTP